MNNLLICKLDTNMKYTTLITAIASVMIFVSTNSVSAQGNVDTIERKITNNSSIITTSSLCEGVAYIKYRQGDSNIDPNFEDNAGELNKIISDLIRLSSDPKVKIKSITITGYGSPEGGFNINKVISDKRAKNYVSYISESTLKKIPYDINLRVSSEPEDWDGLKKMLNDNIKTDVANFTKAIKIIDSIPIFDGREKAIMMLNNGDTYRYMLINMFPKLRRTEYRIEYALTDTKEIVSSDTIVVVKKSEPVKKEVEYQPFYINDKDFKKQVVGIRTNLLYWAVATPNISLDFFLSKKFSLSVNGMYANWDFNKVNVYKHLKWDGYIVGGDFKYWFKNNNRGHYIGLGGDYFDYDVFFREKGKTGSGYGGGLLYGYSLRVSDHFNVVFDVGVGLYQVKNNSYSRDASDASIIHINKSSDKLKVLPSKLGVSLLFGF